MRLNARGIMMLALTLLPCLMGCAAIDTYNGRAVYFNLEAEQAQNQALLLNVVRAYVRHPMQFTTLQNVTGQAGATASTQLTVPFGEYLRKASNPLNQAVASAGLSGSSTFSVPVLDTKEFYEGILGPVPGHLFDYFLQAGYPREMLFDLLVQKIVIRRAGCIGVGACELTFINDVSDDQQFDLFQAFLEYLLRLGLATEPVSSHEGAKAHVRVLADAAAGKAGAKDDKSESDKPSAPSRFCFNRQWAPASLSPAILCGNPSLHTADIGRATEVATVPMSSRLVDRLLDIVNAYPDTDGITINLYKRDLPLFRNQRVTFAVYTRSTAAIMYYLGELVRRQHHPDVVQGQAVPPRIIQIKTGPPYLLFPDEWSCDGRVTAPPADVTYATGAGYSCRNLFVLDIGVAGPGRGAGLGVLYEGTGYSVPTDRLRAGKTTDVLALMRQLFAVSTSAKAEPSSNVISLIAP